jgi:hypothetical protein
MSIFSLKRAKLNYSDLMELIGNLSLKVNKLFYSYMLSRLIHDIFIIFRLLKSDKITNKSF